MLELKQQCVNGGLDLKCQAFHISKEKSAPRRNGGNVHRNVGGFFPRCVQGRFNTSLANVQLQHFRQTREICQESTKTQPEQ